MAGKKKRSASAKAQAKTYGQPMLSRRSATRRSAGKRVMDRRAECAKICSQIDPFCPGAVGSKIGDNNSRPTLPYTQRLTFTVTANANGLALFQISERASACAIPITVNSLGVGTSYGVGIVPSDQADVEASFTGYRVVSTGVRVMCSANVTESKGIVTLATVPENLSATPGLASTDGTSYPEYERYALAGLDANWISKPDGVEAHQFTPFTDYAARTKLILGFSGCTPSTAIAQVEVILHYEYEAKVGDFASRMTTPAAKSNPKHATVQQLVLRQTPSASQGSTMQRSATFIDSAMRLYDTVSPFLSEALELLA